MLHSMIKRVSVNLDNLQFNTCVSEFMIFTNHIQTLITINNDVLKSFIILINPFMPHMAEELWQLSGQENELTFQKWPTFDELLIKADTMKLAVQINGKRRSEIEVDINTVEKEIFETAKSADKISNHLKNKIILKEIYVKGRLVNIVVK